MKPTLLLKNCNFNPCSAGVRLFHYLAALLDAADIPVAVTDACYYLPGLEVRTEALPTDIAVYSDSTFDNPHRANRICRYFAFYANCYNWGRRVPPDQCCLLYRKEYCPDLHEVYDRLLTDEDLFPFPCFDHRFCFPEKKTIPNVLFVGKFSQIELTHFRTQKARLIASGVHWPIADYPPGTKPKLPFPYQSIPHYGSPHGMARHDLYFAHNRTLSILRRTENLYSLDHRTVLAYEAALSGCRVFYVHGPNDFREQHITPEDCQSYIMNPAKDIEMAVRFAERIYKFFGES